MVEPLPAAVPPEEPARLLIDLEAGVAARDYRATSFRAAGAALEAALDAALAGRDLVLAGVGPGGACQTQLRVRCAAEEAGGPRLRFFEGWRAEDFARGLERLEAELGTTAGAPVPGLLVCLESPCEPHGYVLDVPAICRAAHAAGALVLCDRSLGTPFLQPTLRRESRAERPDLVVHAGVLESGGAGDAGFVITPADAAPLPDSPPAPARLAALAGGLRGLELGLLRAGIHTIVLARALAAHPLIRVQSSAAPLDPNTQLARRLTFLGLPAPVFSIDFEPSPGESPWLETAAFERFRARLEGPARGGAAAGEVRYVPGVTPTTLQFRVGDEDPRHLLLRVLRAAEAALEPARPGFMRMFPRLEAIDRLYERAYLAVHHRWIRSRRTMAALALA